MAQGNGFELEACDQDLNFSVLGTLSSTDWMPTHKPTEPLRMKQKIAQ